ncbi:unnamed protein product, partial [Ectocarpus sp. 12 AP-2014]
PINTTIWCVPAFCAKDNSSREPVYPHAVCTISLIWSRTARPGALSLGALLWPLNFTYCPLLCVTTYSLGLILLPLVQDSSWCLCMHCRGLLRRVLYPRERFVPPDPRGGQKVWRLALWLASISNRSS